MTHADVIKAGNLSNDLQPQRLVQFTHLLQAAAGLTSMKHFAVFLTLLAFALAVSASNTACSRSVFLPGPYDGQQFVEQTSGAAGYPSKCNSGSNPDTGAFFATVDVTVGSNFTISTCHSSTDFNTVIAVYTGRNCDSLTCIDSNDDSPCLFRSDASTLSFVTTQKRYWIMISGHANQEGVVQFSLLEEEPKAELNDCWYAQKLQGPYDVPVTVSGTISTDPNADQPCSAESDNGGDWYIIYPSSGANVTVSTCGDYNGLNETVLQVMDDNCFFLQCDDFPQDTCEGSAGRSFVSFIAERDSYHIYVSGRDSATGDYELTVSEAPRTAPSSPQPGSSCDDPYFVDGPGHYDGFTNQFGDYSYLCNRTSSPVFWFAVEVPHGKSFTASTCSKGTNYDTFLAIYPNTADCDTSECLQFDNDQYNCIYGSMMSVTFPVKSIRNVDYYLIAVGGAHGAVGTFDLYIEF